MTSDSRALLWALVVIGIGGVATVVAYSPSFQAGFYFDDVPNIVEASSVHWEEISIQGVRDLLSDSYVRRRVVANTTFALNFVAGGLNPWGFHLVNLIVHLLVGLSLAGLALVYSSESATQRSSSQGAPVAAAAMAVLFMLHPLNIQAVTYVVQRMSSLAALFCIWSFSCYLVGRLSKSEVKRILWLLASFLAWILALGSKETALVLPLVVVAFEACFFRESWGETYNSWSPLIRAVVLAVFGSLVILSAYWIYLNYIGRMSFHWNETIPGRSFSGKERILTQSRVQLFYLSLLLWPAPSRLNLEHYSVVSKSLVSPPSTALAVVFWLVAFVLSVKLARRRPRYGFLLISYFLFHAIESGPISLELVFEHRMYLPMTVFVLLGTVAAADLNMKWRRVGLIAASGLALAYAGATYQRNLVWSDTLMFHYDCAAKSPNKFRPQLNLGIELGRAGQIQEAVAFFEKAVAIEPENAKAHNQLGSAYLRLGRLDEALSEVQVAVNFDPDNAYAQYNLGWILDSLGRGDEAIPHYRRFMELRPAKLESFVEPVQRRLLELSAAGGGQEPG